MISVGLLYNGSLAPDALWGASRPDHVAVIPERFWVDSGRDAQPRYRHPSGPRRVLQDLCNDFPVAAHGLGLSIASAAFFDREHVLELRTLDRQLGFAWISEHLAAFRVEHAASSDHHAGAQIPMPWGPELLDLIASRVEEAQELLARPLLLENGVEFAPIHDPEMSEPEFWHELHRRTGVRMLLDLHNLYVNEVNLGIDAAAWLQALPLTAVEEIHVAGGDWIGDAYFDSHSRRSPPRVHELLRLALQSCSALRAITFEFHESYLGEIGVQGVAQEIQLLRSLIEAGDGQRVAG